MDTATDPESLQLLADSVRTTINGSSGAKLDAALADLGWLEMLDEIPN
ncbi:MAG: acyl-CoA dehydrogenase, partial [Mycobacterium sp.]